MKACSDMIPPLTCLARDTSLSTAAMLCMQGDKVKVTLQFKGREISFQDGANEMMQVPFSLLFSLSLESLELTINSLIQPSRMQGRIYGMQALRRIIHFSVKQSGADRLEQVALAGLQPIM